MCHIPVQVEVCAAAAPRNPDVVVAVESSLPDLEMD
jgi:hypothetical protein